MGNNKSRKQQNNTSSQPVSVKTSELIFKSNLLETATKQMEPVVVVATPEIKITDAEPVIDKSSEMDPIIAVATPEVKLSDAEPVITKEIVQVKVEDVPVVVPVVASSEPPKEAEPLKIPAWLNREFFDEILTKHYELSAGDYTTKDLVTKLATAKGDNYASVMYRCKLDIELTANQLARSFSFIVKCLPDAGMTEEFLKHFNVFPKEVKMYSEIIPELEKILTEHGMSVNFGPKCLKAELGNPTDVIVMEDLTVRDFKMVDRHVGLDMEHTKMILRKMTQFHAASAMYHEVHGDFPECFAEGIYSDKMRPMMEQFMEEHGKTLNPIIESWPFGKKYASIIKKNNEAKTETINALFDSVRPDPNGFNVLNHGDMWCNNMMFIYDEDNKLKDATLVDYQMSNYGSPLMDICYFLFSSTQKEIKFTEFEYFLQYYHENLTENLSKMGYVKRIPSLREFHIEFYKRGYFVINLAFGLLAIVLLKDTEDASMENMLKNDEVGQNFKNAMYNNPLYVSQMALLLPFLERRGLLTY